MSDQHERGAFMYARVQYNWEDPEAFIEEDGVLNVEFPWDEETSPWRCINCEERFTEDEEEEAKAESCVQAECTEHDEDETCTDECSLVHDLVHEPQPFTWVNGASIHIDEEEDQIDLAISLGDPRGAFVMRLYRARDGQIRMEVPYPEAGFLHLPLRQLGPGVYAVNETEPKEKSE